LLAYGERQKLISSYDWAIEADGRIHPEFGFNPSTWRKNARNPNIQTIPKRSELAKAFRRLLIASPGHTLIECDSSAIEAVFVGYFAGSERYIALAKRGVHKWLAQEYAGRVVSKDEPLYDKVKRIVHLSNYLGTPMRIYEEYPDDFESVQEARKLQDFYFAQPEGQDVRKGQQATLSQADYEHKLDTPFGQRHYFYDVLGTRFDNVCLGKDAKRAIAFRPQATASAVQTRYLMTLPEEMRATLPNGQFYIPSLRAIIHDSIILEVPCDLAERYARMLYETMTAPIPELGGLTVGAECKIGPNLRDMKLINF
jgi:DNA polymerase I